MLTKGDLKKCLGKTLGQFGVDVSKLYSWRHLPRYIRERRVWRDNGGKITRNTPILHDYSDNAGTAKGHYFHQDLTVAKQVFEKAPRHHVDVGSRIDGFVAHVAAFRQIEVRDIRDMPPSSHPNIVFKKQDLQAAKQSPITDSLSCLHTIEHFGLGRYGDPIDVNGHISGLSNLIDMLEVGGTLYISFPIGRADEVHFNAHRVFHPSTVLSIPKVREELRLERFDYVDDEGEIHMHSSPASVRPELVFGCGIYTFVKSATG